MPVRTPQKQETAPAAIRTSMVDRLLSHIIPATIFSLLVAFKGYLLIRALSAGSLGWLGIAKEVCGTAFMALMVILFMERRPTVGRRSSAFAGLVALAGTFLLVLPWPIEAPTVTLSAAVRAASDILIIAGTLFAFIGLAYLGRCFGIRPVARGLVTRGPYRWVRHPLYLGEIIFASGWAIQRLSVPMVVLFAAFVGLQYWRALMEEDVLSAAFHEYDDYRKRTYRLIPFVH